MPEITAVVLYDYAAVDSSELTLKAGGQVKVLHQGEDGWWQGELNNVIGKFPGSYVKVEVKSKKEQFKEDMSKAKNKLDDERNIAKHLTSSKLELEKEIQELNSENQKVQDEVMQLRAFLLEILKKEKLETFMTKLEKYGAKIEQIYNAKNKEEELRKGLIDDLTSLKRFLKNPSLDAKKNLKGKSQEKIEAGLGILQLKLNSEGRKRIIAKERLGDLHTDLQSLKRLIVDNTK